MKKAFLRVISLTGLGFAILTPAALSLTIPEAKLSEVEQRLTRNTNLSSYPVFHQFRRAPRTPAAIPANPNKVHQAKIKRRIGGTPIIDVVFNGNKTFEMIVDTGASGTLITQPMARALGIRPVGKIKAGIADGSVVEFPIGRVQSIAVGGAVVKNVSVAIAQKMEIGLLGHDFFSNYDVKIKQDIVEFYPR